MNLISTQDIISTSKIPEGFYKVEDWREVDFSKIDRILQEMYENIKTIDSEFEYKIEKSSKLSTYLSDFATFYDNYKIIQKYKDFEKNFEFLVPTLLYKNFFILKGVLYVPLVFLEKAPIDRVDKNGENTKIFANLNPEYNLTFQFKEKNVLFRMKKISFEIFFRIFYKDDPEKLKILQENEIIEKTDPVTKAEFEKFIKFLGFHKPNNHLQYETIVDFFDKYFLLPYFREIFEDYFGLSNIKDIVWKIFEIYQNNEEIDMANLRNRRVVFIEYLIKPIFQLYLRLLQGIVEEKKNNFLPTINLNAVITTGFNNLMHRGNLYDISLPYPSPLINKFSQDITIIKNGRLPKSWIRNDASAYGIFCPISVSAQETASNIIATTSTIINYYGRIELNS